MQFPRTILIKLKVQAHGHECVSVLRLSIITAPCSYRNYSLRFVICVARSFAVARLIVHRWSSGNRKLTRNEIRREWQSFWITALCLLNFYCGTFWIYVSLYYRGTVLTIHSASVKRGLWTCDADVLQEEEESSGLRFATLKLARKAKSKKT